MIYVRQDAGKIPQKLMDMAKKAQKELEKTPPENRKAFIKKKARIWRAFANCLSTMSYGKCWYSEAKDEQSFFDVDHFRPKQAAKRTSDIEDDGYPWLAFSWENFRYSAGRSNRLSTHEQTQDTVGKGSWFPLFDGSVCANWDDRCEANEDIVLLDPTNQQDISLIQVDAAGMICAGLTCVGDKRKYRVRRSIEVYGLNLPNLTSARAKVMRDIQDDHSTLLELLADDTDRPAIERHRKRLVNATMSNAAYALAARSQLQLLPGGPQLCAKPEDLPNTP
jgi:hypothetical protein